MQLQNVCVPSYAQLHHQQRVCRCCHDHRATTGSTEDRGKASIGQGAFPPSPICSFICQDQLLALAVFLSCPLERGGSQLERGARGYALSPLCGETHGVLERLGAGAGRKSEREHTWGPFVSSQKSGMFFFEGPFFFLFFLQGYLLSVGQIYWRYTRLEGEERPSTSSAGRDTWLETQPARKTMQN